VFIVYLIWSFSPSASSPTLLSYPLSSHPEDFLSGRPGCPKALHMQKGTPVSVTWHFHWSPSLCISFLQPRHCSLMAKPLLSEYPKNSWKVFAFRPVPGLRKNGQRLSPFLVSISTFCSFLLLFFSFLKMVFLCC
jgi:hypothetical protein